MTPVTPRSVVAWNRTRAITLAALLGGSLLVGSLPTGIPLVLSEDGRVWITRAHAYTGLLTLGLAILGPVILKLTSGPKTALDRGREGRFVCECHIVGIATLILLVASLNLAGPGPQSRNGPAGFHQATAETGR